ncbi:MAG: ABC transporter ATP-binding protein [Gemmatimonadota bacterium]
MSLYLRILRYLRPHLGVFLVAAVAMFMFAALDAFSLALLIPFLQTLFGGGEVGGAAAGGRLQALLDATVGRVVDLQGAPQDAIRGIILFILVVVTLKNVFDFIQNVLVARVEQGVTRDLRNDVYDHLLDLDLAFFGRTRTGQIISRLTNDVEQLRTLVTRELAKSLSSVFEFTAAMVLMLGLSVKLTLAAFVVVPGAMGIWGPLVKKLRRGDRRVLDLAGQVSAHVQETLSGIRLVKTSSAEVHERARFRTLTGDYFRTFLRTQKWRALAGPITELFAALGTAVLLWYGARLVLVDGALSGAEFVGFLVLSMKLYSPVKYLSKLPALIQPGLVGAERVFEFMDAPIEIRDRPGARALTGFEDSIVYDHVSFAYRPGEPVLQDVSFTVPKGSVVALVGPSGAGKSTVIDLLGRFYEVGEGRIRIDGTDLRDFTVRSLRRQLGIVSQETVLFHDTVRANIAYGLENVDEAALEQAARAAHAHEFIQQLPDGYDTLVGERGTELSGGQRQRLSIARAILRDPPILIFDEATSALDTESERLVQAAIERLLAGRTVFVIAHRLSTIQKADRILVFEEGRLVESGPHQQLVEGGGLYSRLHALQAVGDYSA